MCVSGRAIPGGKSADDTRFAWPWGIFYVNTLKNNNKCQDEKRADDKGMASCFHSNLPVL
jgi:hypothetical protein